MPLVLIMCLGVREGHFFKPGQRKLHQSSDPVLVKRDLKIIMANMFDISPFSNKD